MIEKAGAAIATLRGTRLEHLLRLRPWRNKNYQQGTAWEVLLVFLRLRGPAR
jgi:hypothetical protein